MNARTLATRLIDAWTAECRKPGAHTFEDVAVPMLEEWRRGWPPSELPVFTGVWLKKTWDQIDKVTHPFFQRTAWESFATAINTRFGTLRPAPASEPDLERMQEAYHRAKDKWSCDINRKVADTFAKYLAAEGFRLGEVIKNIDDGGALERDIQARIDAAVLAERETQGDAVMRLAHVKQFCEAWLHPDRLEDGTIDASAQKALQGVWQVAGFDAIRARTTNTQIAPAGEQDEPCTDCDDTGITAQTEKYCTCDVGLGLRNAAAGGSPAPSRKVVATQMTIEPGQGIFYTCLCDDGTCWWLDKQTWKQFPPIPQPGETP